jgi:hypothetical protein
MAYNNFKANVWEAAILTELERKHVFVTDCNRAYEGTVKGVGDSVTIKNAGDVTVTDYSDGEQHAFSTPEFVEGQNQIMTIKHISQYNFMVGDIDREQGAGKALDVYTKQAAQKIANKHDLLVASLAGDPQAKKHANSAVKVDSTNVFEEIDKAITMLWENDVPANEYLVLDVSPRFYQVMKQQYIKLDTDNSEMIKRGAVAMYSGVDIKLSNNVLTANSGANDLIMLRTKQAIAFVNQLTKTEPYRPEAYQADAVKGQSLYDAKLIKPKEMVVLNVKYA